MSRHRARPDRRLRYWNTLATTAAVLAVAGLLGIADNVGDDFTPAAHTTPTFSRPVDDDPGQFGRRGLPVPARIFPTDLNAPHYAIGDGGAATETPTVALSAPVRACRCLPRVPGPSQTVTGLSEGPLAEVTTEPTPTVTEPVTEPPTPAAETTAATQPVDPPQETSVPDEPTVPVEPPAVPEIMEEVGVSE